MSIKFLETISRVKYFLQDIREGGLYNVEVCDEFFFVHSDLSFGNLLS